MACIDPHQTGFVGKGSDRLKLIKFWPSCAPGKGSAAGQKNLTPPCYSQRAVFASLWALFSFHFGFYQQSVIAYYNGPHVVHVASESELQHDEY